MAACRRDRRVVGGVCERRGRSGPSRRRGDRRTPRAARRQLPPAAGCVVGSTTCDHVSCAQLYRDGVATTDGPQVIDPDGAGPLTAVQVWCDMTTDGGGWTVIARALDVTYTTPPPPPIGDGTLGAWSDWAALAWQSGDSYYIPLDAFAALTAGGVTLRQLSRNSGGTTTSALQRTGFAYHVATNSAVVGTCTNLVGSPCSSACNWGQYGGATPFFDGYRQPGGGTTNCNAGYPGAIWGYHNWSNCASDSGLFNFNATTTPRPQLLGSYQVAAPENVIMVRGAVDPTSCAALLAAAPATPTGVYTIDPDGFAGAPAFAVWCDMTPGNAGWTYGLIVNTETPSASYTRVAGYTAFGAAAGPALGTAYGVNLTGVRVTDVRIDNFTLGTRVTRSAAAQLTWGGTQYTSLGSLPAMRFDLAGGFSLRAGYYVGGCTASDAHIPVCFASTSEVRWVCDSDYQYIEGWVDCSGGEICGGGYIGTKVWRDASYSPQCTPYLGAATPAVYGFAVR